MSEIDSAKVFAVVAVLVALASALLAGGLPIGCSIVVVFLFAGPHNWLEARYMLSRMPARWGPLRPFFLTGLLGVPLLTAAAAAMPHLLNWRGANAETWLVSTAIWNACFGAWVLTLIHLRSREHAGRDWSLAVPIGLTLIAAGILWPIAWSLLLVYVHPLIAMWFLDREIGKHRPECQGAWRKCLLLVPALLGILWWSLWSAPDLPGEDLLSMQITNHAGASMLRGLSSHALVATHTFLEILHYGVWIIAIPYVGIRRAPWSLDGIPLARRATGWKLCVLAILTIGLLAVLTLWVGFLIDYPLTRDVYFTVAMLHVLAEVPFLLRLL
jgi:hypothetical protein